MRNARISLGKGIIALIVMSSLGGIRLAAQGEMAVPPPVPQQELPEVLTRGPVHEAFAEPVDLQMQAPVTAPTHPPADIAEVPPTEKPEGDEYVWVPGYWAWDQERNEFVWVSACWRIPPPGMYWVPGYWVEGNEGWDWVSGFWAASATSEIEYLPPPPEIDESSAAAVSPPSENVIWVSPCYYRSSGNYVLRPGYWLNAQPDWIWVPSHYVWTPRGYVFAPGHWDYPLDNRGVLFAPVYFPEQVRMRPAYTYSPSVVVNLTLLTGSLFAYPRYRHYYFGDYYDRSYLQIGIYPWFDSDRHHTWYDPVYQHNRWRHHRADPRWEERERYEYQLRCNDQGRRPPRTYREQTALLERMSEPERQKSRVVFALSDVAAKRIENKVRLQKLDTAARQKIEKQGNEIHQYSRDRNKWESGDNTSGAGKPPIMRTDPKPPKPGKRADEVSPQPSVVVKPLPKIEHPDTGPRNKKEGELKKQPPVVIQQPPAINLPPKETNVRRGDGGLNQPPVVVGPPPVIDAPAKDFNPRRGDEDKKQSPFVVKSTPDIKPEYSPPRSVRATKPDRVIIPPSPVVEKAVLPGKRKNVLPPSPDGEPWKKDDGKGSRKDGKERGGR
jgi:hypothetical protein